MLVNQDEAVDTIMEKDRRKQTNQLSVSVASDLALTMKQKCPTYTCQESYEDVGSRKECKQQQQDVEQQWQALPFKL